MTTRLVLIGGFLGAGKTTLINKIAGRLHAGGKGVALITNDQGVALVDTQYSSGKGFDTAEVLRGCFCCRFPDFIQAARDLVSRYRPEFLITEPVGSCTDLQATVLTPLRSLYQEEFTVAPLIVMVDSSRLKSDDLEGGTIGGYLRKHQIEEAEYVVISKADLITSDRMEEIERAVRELNPRATTIVHSTITGQGFDDIMRLITSEERSSGIPRDVDYDIYANAEAELGWYNGHVSFSAPKVDAYDLGRSILKHIAEGYAPEAIAHAKVLLRSEAVTVKMSLISGHMTVDGVKGSRYAGGDVEVFVNARVVSTPERLREWVREAVRMAMEQSKVPSYEFDDDCFSPGWPNPTYRMQAGN